MKVKYSVHYDPVPAYFTFLFSGQPTIGLVSVIGKIHSPLIQLLVLAEKYEKIFVNYFLLRIMTIQSRVI